jgi:phage terminase large subunit-like protein
MSQLNKTTTELCNELLSEDDIYYYHKTFERHLNDLERLDKNNYRFNEKLGKAYILLLESFRHYKGSDFAGKHFILSPWQDAAIRIAMGWEKKVKDISTGKDIWVRRFNTLLFVVARKAGKTLLSAGLSWCDTILRPEPFNEIACSATSRDQARIAWEAFREMGNAHPDLKRKMKVVHNLITYKPDGSTIFPVSKDGKRLDGKNLGIIICDEYAAHPDSSLFDVLKSSQGARRQPLSIIISTAGHDLGSPLIFEIEHAKNIFDGSLNDENYFAFCAIPDKEEKFTLEALKAANPNMGVSVSQEYLVAKMQEAKGRPDRVAEYLTKHENRFLNGAEEFIPLEDVRKCIVSEDEFNKILQSEKIKKYFIGLDFSVSDDWSAVTEMILLENGKMMVKCIAFIPEFQFAERAKTLRAPLDLWKDKGLLRVTKGKTINQNDIFEYVKDLLDKNGEIGDCDPMVTYDPYRAKVFISRLEEELGFMNSVSVYQGYRHSTEPLAILLMKIKSHEMILNENDALFWQFSNLEVVFDTYGNMKIEKSNRYKKIDNVAALMNTIFGAIPFIEEDGSSEVIWI